MLYTFIWGYDQLVCPVLLPQVSSQASGLQVPAARQASTWLPPEVSHRSRWVPSVLLTMAYLSLLASSANHASVVGDRGRPDRMNKLGCSRDRALRRTAAKWERTPTRSDGVLATANTRNEGVSQEQCGSCTGTPAHLSHHNYPEGPIRLACRSPAA